MRRSDYKRGAFLYNKKIYGNNGKMRNPLVNDKELTIKKLNNMKGTPLTVKVNRGRNKIEVYDGEIESTYPNVFTVRLVDGGLGTFSYADIASKNIAFYRRKI